MTCRLFWYANMGDAPYLCATDSDTSIISCHLSHIAISPTRDTDQRRHTAYARQARQSPLSHQYGQLHQKQSPLSPQNTSHYRWSHPRMNTLSRNICDRDVIYQTRRHHRLCLPMPRRNQCHSHRNLPRSLQNTTRQSHYMRKISIQTRCTTRTVEKQQLQYHHPTI